MGGSHSGTWNVRHVPPLPARPDRRPLAPRGPRRRLDRAALGLRRIFDRSVDLRQVVPEGDDLLVDLDWHCDLVSFEIAGDACASRSESGVVSAIASHFPAGRHSAFRPAPVGEGARLAVALNVQQQLRIGVDTGGTFTDLVAVDETTGERRTVKVPSTPARPVDAVFTALEGVQADAGRRRAVRPRHHDRHQLPAPAPRRAHALPHDGGLRGRAVHPAHQPPRAVRHALAQAAALRAARGLLGVRERLASDGGVRVPLERGEVERVVGAGAGRRTPRTRPSRSPSTSSSPTSTRPHERLLADAIAEALPDVPVSVSSEIAPVWREYERGNTTIVDAYLRRLVGRLRRRARGRARRRAACPARASC